MGIFNQDFRKGSGIQQKIRYGVFPQNDISKGIEAMRCVAMDLLANAFGSDGEISPIVDEFVKSLRGSELTQAEKEMLKANREVIVSFISDMDVSQIVAEMAKVYKLTKETLIEGAVSADTQQMLDAVKVTVEKSKDKFANQKPTPATPTATPVQQQTKPAAVPAPAPAAQEDVVFEPVGQVQVVPPAPGEPTAMADAMASAKQASKKKRQHHVKHNSKL